MEYLKNYDIQLSYHPKKANVVVDALSRKENVAKSQQLARLWLMLVEVVAINPMDWLTGFMANLVISNDLVSQVKLAQMEDEELNKLLESTPKMTVNFDSVLSFKGILCVLRDETLR